MITLFEERRSRGKPGQKPVFLSSLRTFCRDGSRVAALAGYSVGRRSGVHNQQPKEAKLKSGVRGAHRTKVSVPSVEN